MQPLKSLYACSAILCLLATVQSSPNLSAPRTGQSSPVVQQGEQPAKVSLRASAPKNAINSGEILELRVEIWNEGSTDVFVCKDFGRNSWPFCHVDFTIEDSSGRSGSQLSSAIDLDPFQKVPLARALVRDWIALRPNHFCGTTVKLDPATFPQLRKLGRHKVLAEYSSPGLVQGYHGTLVIESGELERLPAKSWQGQVEAKPVIVRILPERH
jgi:hypothetical protein